MAMKSAPATATGTTPNKTNVDLAVIAGKKVTTLGDFADATGKKYVAHYNQDDHKVVIDTNLAGGVAPTITFLQHPAFLAGHQGHALTHVGQMAGPNGVGDALFCQKDNALNIDYLT